MPYLRPDRSEWYVAIPTRTGRLKRSAGTTHKPTAKRIEKMLADLGPRGRARWDVLDRIVDGSLSLGAVLEAWDRNALDTLLATFADEDLAPHIQPFLDHHAGEGARGHAVSNDTIKHYKVVFRHAKRDSPCSAHDSRAGSCRPSSTATPDRRARDGKRMPRSGSSGAISSDVASSSTTRRAR